MARIIKVRTVPRGYQKVDDAEFIKSVDILMGSFAVSDLFTGLYFTLGNPQKKGLFSYMFRHNNVVIELVAKDRSTLECSMWVSPGYILEARRRRVKAVNVIARKVNGEGLVFALDDESLYYAVRRSNDALKAKETASMDVLREKMNDNLTFAERRVLYGGLMQFVPEVEAEVRDLIARIVS